ncbi:MAG: ATP-binding cassette domain-containing protein [Alphaproteobacteria bacterium]|nr:ATP-binding cassette domain-containing protein [Alphaproteobacteria bacterium]
MERRLFTYIWRHSLGEQLRVLTLIVLSLPFYFLSLNLPKLIVNGPIQGGGFENGASRTYYVVTLPDWLGGAQVFDGLTLDRMSALFALSFSFLALVCINGLFKYRINVMKGQMGERLLRRLRYELVDRVLRFYPARLRRTKPAEVASMVKDEVEPLGGFVGEAFATPAYLGGQAATAVVFIMLQSVFLGAVAVGIVSIQAFLIPYLRKPILALGRQRQLTARELSGRVGEIVDAAADIQANDTSNWERADITRRLGRIFDIRFEIYRRKFFVKFLNNFLAQVTPFFFYAVGGYYAIHGELSIGQLVAVIAAYKDLPAPVKELLDWYLEKQDAQIKYEQVVEQFGADRLIDPRAHAPLEPPPLSGRIEVREATVADDTGARLLDGVSFDFEVTDHVGLAGPPGGGKEAAAALIARQVSVRSGQVLIAGQAIDGLPQALTGRRIAYVGQEAYLFGASLKDNLLYGLRNQPRGAANYDGPARQIAMARQAESARAGNAPYDAEADWIDYRVLGCDGPAGVDGCLMRSVAMAGLDADVFRFGLQGRFDPDDAPAVAERLLKARSLFMEREMREQVDIIEPFDVTRYNSQASIAENLLFGVAIGQDYAPANLSHNRRVMNLLEREQLVQPLFTLGRGIAETMVEIFRGLPPDHPFFAQFSFIAAADLPLFEAMLGRLDGGQALNPEQRLKMIGLGFAYSEARHRLGLLDDALRQRLLAARALLRDSLPQSEKAKIAFYDAGAYNEAASVEDNILFGRIVYGVPSAQQRIEAILLQVITDLNLKGDIARIGLGFSAGAAGKRLTPSQRQRLALARALVKSPDLLIVNGALAVLDPAAQGDILRRVLDARKGRGVVWTLGPGQDHAPFDRVIGFEGGRLAGSA